MKLMITMCLLSISSLTFANYNKYECIVAARNYADGTVIDLKFQQGFGMSSGWVAKKLISERRNVLGQKKEEIFLEAVGLINFGGENEGDSMVDLTVRIETLIYNRRANRFETKYEVLGTIKGDGPQIIHSQTDKYSVAGGCSFES